jgi:energy-converting hydrogenase A subunit C
MLEETIIAIIVIYMVLRLFVTLDRLERMPYLNVINFSVAAIITLQNPSPLGAVTSMIYFIMATVGANAIAFTIDKIGEIEKHDND